MITNDAGEVAIRHYQPIQKLITVGNTSYVFIPKFNISIAWIKPEHVDTVLRMRKSCCGNRKHKMFTITDQTHVDRWSVT